MAITKSYNMRIIGTFQFNWGNKKINLKDNDKLQYMVSLTRQLVGQNIMINDL